MGDHIRVRISAAGTDEFIVKIRNSIERQSLNKGDIVNMGWLSKDCRALAPLNA
jgi:putative spermidine/putrescine transport system ATP-binding protein